MSWKSYFFPQTILLTTSPYNRHIRVNEEQGKMKLLVNGSPQSGTYIKKLWASAFRHFSMQSRSVKDVLVLGLGGGTVLTLLHDMFPTIHQTCVDIDTTILAIARRYFSVDGIPHVGLVESDAKTYVHRMVQKKKTYDCVIVDLSFGRTIPSFVKQRQFLQQIYTLIAPGGCLFLNYLREKEYRIKSDALFQTLQSVFLSVSDFEIANNRFFYARK